MDITTLADLNAQPLGPVVLDNQGGVWQSSEYTQDTWFAPGSEIERTAAQMLEIGPLRLIHTPGPTPTRVYLDGGQVDFAAVDRYFNEAVTYVLRNAAKSSLPDSWRTLTGEQLTGALSTHLLAGLHPVLFEYAVNSGLRVARAEIARAAATCKRAENGA